MVENRLRMDGVFTLCCDDDVDKNDVDVGDTDTGDDTGDDDACR